ncbi:MAG: chorismate mutase [Pseudooceanicola sp.]
MRRIPEELDSLEALRAQIDEIDGALLALLAERQAHVDRVTVVKAREGVSAAAPGRFAAVIENVRRRAGAAGMEPDIAEAMWRAMIVGFIAREERVLGKDGMDG